jgi:hypothetical protein
MSGETLIAQFSEMPSLSKSARAMKVFGPPFFCFVCLLILVGYAWTRTSGYLPDTIRYIDAALNFKNEARLVLSRYQQYFPFLMAGREPRVLTEQPPLYPIMIAFISSFGINELVSARAITAAFFLLIPFPNWALIRRNLEGMPAVCCLAVTIFNYGLFKWSVFGMSESMAIFFGVCVLLELSTFWKKLNGGKGSWGHLWLALVFFGLAAATRFTLAFMLPGILAWLFSNAWKTGARSRLILWSITALAVTVGLFSIRLFFTGAEGLQNVGPLAGYLQNAKSAVIVPIGDIFFGGFWSTAFSKWQLYICILLIALGIGIVTRRSNRSQVVGLVKEPLGLLIMVSVSYLLILWVGTSTQTVDPIDTRYAMVVYPCLTIALFRLLVSLGNDEKRVNRIYLILVVTVVCVALNARGMGKAAAELTVRAKPVNSLRWINENVHKEDIILSTSHYLGYWLDRQCFYLPRQKWHGFVFGEEDASLCARASQRVWMTVTEQDKAGAEEGKWGPFVAQMLLRQKGDFYRKIASLDDGEMFIFEIKGEED